MLQTPSLTDLEHAVREAMMTSPLSMYMIAKRSGVSRQTIYRLKRGEGVTISTLCAIASVLGLSLSVQDNSGAKHDSAHRSIHV